MERAKTSVKSRTATSHPQHRSTGSLEKGPPAAFRPRFRLSAGTVPQARLDFVPSRQHFRPLCWDHTSGPETTARVFLTLSKMTQVRTCGHCHVRAQKESSHSAPHLVQHFSSKTWGSPATRAFDQQALVAAVSSAPYMAWVSRFSKNRKCFLKMDTSQHFFNPAPSQWVAAVLL